MYKVDRRDRDFVKGGKKFENIISESIIVEKYKDFNVLREKFIKEIINTGKTENQSIF